MVLTKSTINEIAKLVDTDLITDVTYSKMELAFNDTHLFLIFHIAVDANVDIYSIYTMTQIPSWHNDTKTVTFSKSKAIAVQHLDRFYAPLSPEELTQCLPPAKTCNTANGLIPATLATCGPNEWFGTKRKCRTINQNETHDMPFFYVHANMTIFSVPDPVEIHLFCEHTHEEAGEDKRITIRGRGKLIFRPGCTLTTPSGIKWTNQDKIRNDRGVSYREDEPDLTNIHPIIADTEDDFNSIADWDELKVPNDEITPINYTPTTMHNFWISTTAATIMGILITALILWCLHRQYRRFQTRRQAVALYKREGDEMELRHTFDTGEDTTTLRHVPRTSTPRIIRHMPIPTQEPRPANRNRRNKSAFTRSTTDKLGKPNKPEGELEDNLSLEAFRDD
jgi:hypothetical protein